MNAKETARQEAINSLTDIQPGDTVHTILRHVSRSGMMRVISLIYIDKNGATRNISGLAAKAMDMTLDRDRFGIKIGGCGMDMGFDLVYSLARTLFAGGHECSGQETCLSNDHSNGDRNYEPHHHKDSGYALKHKWL